MDARESFRKLLVRSTLAILCGAAAIAFCYFFVDRRVAIFVHDRAFDKHPIWKWLTEPPPIIQAWAPAVIVLAVLRRAWAPLGRWERTALAASVSIILADQFRESLSFLFGRYWPETWIDNNPSLIGDGAYGFHPLNGGSAFGSFPSGHTARIFAVTAPIWIAYPLSRIPCAGACSVVIAGLLAMNYHFVGDILGGALVGSLVGAYVAWFLRVAESSRYRDRE